MKGRQSSLCSAGSSTKVTVLLFGTAQQRGCDSSDQGHLSCSSPKGKDRALPNRSTAPKASLLPAPTGSLNTQAGHPFWGKSQGPDIFPRAGTSLHTGIDPGAQHLLDMPEVSKTGTLTAPKGFGYPIPRAFRSTYHSKLLESPVKPRP